MLFIVFHLVRVQTSLQTNWNAHKVTQEPTIIQSVCLGPSLDESLELADKICYLKILT